MKAYGFLAPGRDSGVGPDEPDDLCLPTIGPEFRGHVVRFGVGPPRLLGANLKDAGFGARPAGAAGSVENFLRRIKAILNK